MAEAFKKNVSLAEPEYFLFQFACDMPTQALV